MNREHIAFVFPGQGSQFVGMGRTLAESSPEARAVFDEIDAVLGRPVSRLCFEGPEPTLRQTAETQPAVFAASVAAWAALQAAGVEGSMTAGHSLGEYAALVAAGSLDLATAARLVEIRGRAMDEAGRRRPGAMAAVLGLAADRVPAVAEAAAAAGLIVPANWNAPDQVVFAGEPAGIERAVELARAQGARRALKLNVSGAFHSPLMAAATAPVGEALAGARIFSPTRLRFISNVTADFEDDPTKIGELLVRQLTSPVRWVEVVQRLVRSGAQVIVEVGPGSVLTGLARRIDAALKCYNFNDTSDLARMKAEIERVP